MLSGSVCIRLLQLNAAIVRGLTCCKTIVKQWALRKIWPTKFPLVGGKPYPASGLITLISCHNQELWVEMLTL